MSPIWVKFLGNWGEITLKIDRFPEAFTQGHKCVCYSQKIYPRSPKILHGYIRHIRDIFQLCLYFSPLAPEWPPCKTDSVSNFSPTAEHCTHSFPSNGSDYVAREQNGATKAATICPINVALANGNLLHFMNSSTTHWNFGALTIKCADCGLSFV